MKAELIRGKPGRTKQQRMRDNAFKAVPGDSMSVVTLVEALEILDFDEPGEPDMVQVTMTVEEAEWFVNHTYPTSLPVRTELGNACKEALSQLTQ